MAHPSVSLLAACIAALFLPSHGGSAPLDDLFKTIPAHISGDRARDYTMRIWRYDKWSTLPMWQKSANEAKTIMLERGFDEAEVVNTPADGRSKNGTWVNPLGWDVKSATLEVVDPPNLPDEYRFLADYSADPTSLGNWSCPTPPGGVEAELVLLENPDVTTLQKLDARGKILLTDSQVRHLKRYFEGMGVLGTVCAVRIGDFVNARSWINGWSDMPGGWLMNDYDSKKQFQFSISAKQGEYLRNLLRQGKKVKVRAKVDSRYFTDGSFPYATGCVKGTGDEEVLIVGHLFEWGANDNSTGVASILEAVGALNDLIASGRLPRPKRSLRVCFGHEMWGMMAYASNNIDRLRAKTIAAVNCDGPAGNRELSKYHVTVMMNPNACPSYTDALLPEVARRYYQKFVPYKLIETAPYAMWDDLFADPSMGVPSNTITLFNLHVTYDMYHNSMDTIDKVDPNSLRDLAAIHAVYLYFLATAGYGEIPFIGQLAYDRGLQVVLEKSKEATDRLAQISDGENLGKELATGTRIIEYYADLQKQALKSALRTVDAPDREKANRVIDRLCKKIDDYGVLAVRQFSEAVADKAGEKSLKLIKPAGKTGEWERVAETIVPKRKYIGTITLMDIPSDQWVEVTSSPKTWSARNPASASLWWCDGKRNLLKIKELVELESGQPVGNFDLVKYYRFLEQRGLVEFVK